MKAFTFHGYKAFSYSSHWAASCSSLQLKCHFRRAHTKHMFWRLATFPGPLPCLLLQILWHFLHLDLGLQSLATFKTTQARRHPKQMVFSTHPCNQDPARENGTVVSGWHEEALTSPAEITGIRVSWVKATSTPERSKKDGTEDWQLSVVPAVPEEERIG